MINKKFLILCTMSAVLATTVLGAKIEKCAGGVCFINLANLQPSKGFEKKKENLLVLEKPRYIKNINIQNDFIDKSMTIILDGEMITVFPHSSYVQSESEAVYYDDEVNQSELLVIEESDRIEDIILDKTGLPNSEFFCEKNTKPLYDIEKHTFQCV